MASRKKTAHKKIVRRVRAAHKSHAKRGRPVHNHKPASPVEKELLPVRRESPFTDEPVPKSIHLETDIDRLYDIVKEEGSVYMNEVVKRLGVPEEQVRDWADILENHKLIDIDYPVMGNPVFKLRKLASEAGKENQEWRKIEEKIKAVDKNHRRRFPKAPLIPIAAIVVGAAVLYATSLQYTVIDGIMTFINQNPPVMAFLNSLPLSDLFFQNIIHAVFGAFALLVAAAFLVYRLTRHKRKKKT